jgi:serine/threonine-protein kinase
LSIDGRLVLPADVQIVPVPELSPEVRAKFDAADDDFTITRRRLRAPSSVVDKDSVALLESFRSPTRIVDAIVSFASKRGLNPQTTLEQAYPVLARLYRGRMLVPAEGDAARQIEGSLEAGDTVDRFRLVRRIQVLEDNEVFLARDEAGRYAAVKFYRAPDRDWAAALEREAAVLGRIRAGRAPEVYGLFRQGGGVGLATEWIFGDDALMAAGAVRACGEADREQRLLGLCAQVAGAFADVHESGLLHGDVHPNNVLVERSGRVRLIDFGLARDIVSLSVQDRRGGVPFYFDPEFAQALRLQQPIAASVASEQYSVAALIYQMWTGVHYLDWSLERDRLLSQIVEDEPLSFEARRVPAWEQLERVLRRALHKDPAQRFGDLRSFTQALEALSSEARQRDRPPPSTDRKPGPDAELLQRALQRYRLSGTALRDGLAEAPRASINYGAAGIAYALLRIAERRSEPGLLALADLWVQKAYAWAASEDGFYNAGFEIERSTVGERSLFHSIAGVHCVRALVSAAQSDASTANRSVLAFIEHSRGANDAVGRAYRLDAVIGRASLLLGCAELIESAGELPSFDHAPVRARGEELAGDILHALESAPIEASELTTLGIAHGWAGLLFALLRWTRVMGTCAPAVVRTRLDELAMFAQPHGVGMRWPVARGESSHMDGWCNGSAGYAMLYALAYEGLGESCYGELAERAALSACASSISLGTLCCGQAGIGYASLAAYRVTGSNQWVGRARASARLAALDRSPYMLRDALYKGAVGVALLVDELSAPGAASMPLLEPRR